MRIWSSKDCESDRCADFAFGGKPDLATANTPNPGSFCSVSSDAITATDGSPCGHCIAVRGSSSGWLPSEAEQLRRSAIAKVRSAPNRLPSIPRFRNASSIPPAQSGSKQAEHRRTPLPMQASTPGHHNFRHMISIGTTRASTIPRVEFLMASAASDPWISWTDRWGGFSPFSTSCRLLLPNSTTRSLAS